MRVSVKAFEREDDSAVKAGVNLTFDNIFVVKGSHLIEGKKGLFLSMPHHKVTGEDGSASYVDDAFPLNKELRDKIQEAAIQSFKNAEQEVSFTYNGPERSAEEVISGREGARLGEAEGRPSVLKILADKEEPPKDTHRPIKLSWGSPKKGKDDVSLG